MSRWVDAGALVMVGVLALTASPALADDDEARPRHIWAPEDMPGRGEPVVIKIKPERQVITSVAENLAGTTQIASNARQLDVVLESSVLFTKDSAELLPAAKKELATVVGLLKQRGPGAVDVVGYTDDLGTAEHGQQLSEKRAAAVESVLKPALSGYTVQASGRGEDDPRVPNSSEENRAKNRRVEITHRAE